MIHEHITYTAECDICHQKDGNYKTRQQAEEFLNKYHNDNCIYNPKAKRCQTCTLKCDKNIWNYIDHSIEYYTPIYFCIHAHKSDSWNKPMVATYNSCKEWSNVDVYDYSDQEVYEGAKDYESFCLGE